MAQPLKVAYLTSTNPLDKRAWSGTHFYMLKALKDKGCEVYELGPYEPTFAGFIGKAITGISQFLFKKRYNYRHSKLLSKAYASYFESKLKKLKVDVIVAPASSVQIAELKTSIPIIHISDATLAISLDYHKALSDLWPFSKKESLAIERAALNNASLTVFSSEWAAQSAQVDFGVERSKIKIIPFGANFDIVPQSNELSYYPNKKPYKLLFIGSYWDNKGGPIALEALRILSKANYNVELIVCGCKPPEGVLHPHMQLMPFMNKNTNEGLKKLTQLFNEAFVLILPTRFDCTPIVICEAAAMGLPVIATNTGGIPSLIQNESTGYLIPYEDQGKLFAEKVEHLIQNPNLAQQMSKNARINFESKLNWEHWANEIVKLAESLSNNTLNK